MSTLMQIRFLNIGKANAVATALREAIAKRGGEVESDTRPYMNARAASAAIDRLESDLVRLGAADEAKQIIANSGRDVRAKFTAPESTPARQTLPSMLAEAERAVAAVRGDAHVAALYKAKGLTANPSSLETQLARLGLMNFEIGRIHGEHAAIAAPTPRPAATPLTAATLAAKPAAVCLRALANHIFGDDPLRTEAAAKNQIYFAGIDVPGVDNSDVIAKRGERPKPRGTGKLWETEGQRRAKEFLSKQTK
jgi:hypothetical protein